MSALYLKPTQDYFKNYCKQHVLLQHDDEENVVFIRFQTLEELGSIKNNASGYFVMVDNITGRAAGDPDDSRLRQELTILFLKRVEPADGDPYGKIEKAQQEAFDILFDFFARLKHDFEEDNCGPLKYLKPEQMSFDPVEAPVQEDHYGWLMTIPYDVNAPAYNPDKWNTEDDSD